MVETRVERGGKIERERRYYLSSARLDAKTFAHAGRAHWGIENRLHWVLDVVFHDDLARLRTGNGPQNLAIVKHKALNLVRNPRSEEHTSELQSLMRISYAVFCLKTKPTQPHSQNTTYK